MGHAHRNIDLLNSLSFIKDYLLVNEKKIKAGYADLAKDIEGDKYLHKDRTDRTNFLLEFGEFIDSLTAGKGAGIYPNGHGQFERLEVRSSLTVLELIFNRLSAMEGDQVFTESGSIERVEYIGEDTYRLTLKKRWSTDFTALDVDMICRGIVNTMLQNGEYYTSWTRVLSKNIAENTITVVMYPDSEVPGGKNYPPADLMKIHRWGSVNGDNPKYQRCWYLSSTEGRLVYLTNVNKPILEDYMYSSFHGLPVNLKAFENLPINYDDPYLYARGAIIQELIRLDRQGKPIYDITDRGPWSMETAMSDDPYLFEEKRTSTGLLETHDVWHNSCRYRCLRGCTVQEPKWNASDWDEVSGDPTLRIDFEKPNGDAFFNEIDCPIHVRVYKGVEDITDDVLEADIEWSRTSDDPAADIAWPATHPGEKKYIHIAEADCPGEITTFTCKAFVRDGKSVRSVDRTETIEQ